MWTPTINRFTQKKATFLYQKLKADIESGELALGEQLPTQGELAYRSGISKSTIARVYQRAHAEGLITTHVGRGSYVTGAPNPYLAAVTDTQDAVIDLRVDYPMYHLDPSLEPVLHSLAQENPQKLLTYHESSGHQHHRDAGAHWLNMNGITCCGRDIVVTSGAQHAILVSLASAMPSGGTVFVEELTYPGIFEAAEMLRLKLKVVSLDDGGVDCNDLEECFYSTPGAKVFYTSPSHQNPTTALTGLSRRREVASLCERHGVFVIEDDVYRMYQTEKVNTYSQLLPDLTFLIASFSKSVCGGLRIAYLVPPQGVVKLVSRRLLASLWTLPPITAEIACRWIEDGTAATTLKLKTSEAVTRSALAKEVFRGKPIRCQTSSCFAWLDFSSHQKTQSFVEKAKRSGVAVLSDQTFRPKKTRSGRNGVRICLGAEPDLDRLRGGLEKLNAIF